MSKCHPSPWDAGYNPACGSGPRAVLEAHGQDFNQNPAGWYAFSTKTDPCSVISNLCMQHVYVNSVDVVMVLRLPDLGEFDVPYPAFAQRCCYVCFPSDPSMSTRLSMLSAQWIFSSSRHADYSREEEDQSASTGDKNLS